MRDLTKLIDEISLRMRLFKAAEEAGTPLDDLTDREVLILELLNERGKLNISEIAAAFSRVATSTISVTITKLWRGKGLVVKAIDPGNQRATTVELSAKGVAAVAAIKKGRAERYRELVQALGIEAKEHELLKSIIARAVEHFDQRLDLTKQV